MLGTLILNYILGGDVVCSPVWRTSESLNADTVLMEEFGKEDGREEEGPAQGGPRPDNAP